MFGIDTDPSTSLCICAVLRLITTVKVYYPTYDITWESLDVWIWTGIESHMAIVCASLPAMNHFFKNILQDTRLGSAVKSWSHKYSGGSSGSRSRSKGYEETTSHSGTEIPQKGRGPLESQKGIHVVQDVRLKEFLDDKTYDHLAEGKEHDERQWARGTNFIDQESINTPKAVNTWLENDTSSGDDDSTHRQEDGSSRQYSGYADTRRFY